MNEQPNNPFPTVVEGPIGSAIVQTVNARDLHRALGVGKVFAAWISERIAAYAFNEGTDFAVFSETGNNPSGGRPSKEYALTLDMAKELAMVERNEAGKRVRQYFIECERKLKDRPAIAVNLRDPSQLAGVALQLIDINKELTVRIERAEEEIGYLGPKADAHDRIAEAHGSLCITDAAKNLQVPPRVLFRWLRENSWVYRRVGVNFDIAYQSKITAGYLVHKVEVFDKPDGTEGSRTQVRVTPRGLTVLAKAFPPAAQEVRPSANFVAGIVGAAAIACGLMGSPEAKALPMPDGYGVIWIGGKAVTFDTNRFQPAPDAKFLVVGERGPVLAEPLRYDEFSPLLRGRKAMSCWREPVKGEDPAGAMAVSDGVFVIGAVVDKG